MIERQVVWTKTAQGDLDSIVDYIATDSVENALSVLDRLQERAQSLVTSAERGRLVPELRVIDVHHYREIIERPWRILYRIEPERVLVFAVLDGRRDLSALLLERLVRS
ncbi:plasmid stabilization protein [Thiocystis minor]|uniref:type II toxin-antitoxin system RelE/ParE family toxin n=1 Tax=Thiocystis minor TaxID=61597 RepID=UPI0019139532|nr:type II toxin-antitoxin system RelE/ParE family toxin [Thiocystis minor]MBK5966195.1 plasmid stabilization protein [Thiocystis minor]